MPKIAPRRSLKILAGDTLEVLRTLPDNSVHCVVTSPPYWMLRDYGMDGQMGMEQTFEQFLYGLVQVFDEVKRVLHPSGTLWLNMGDSYNSSRTRGSYGDQSDHGYQPHGVERAQIPGLHEKNLVGQPWHLAFALQEAGWILRDDIIWYKTNPMPSSVRDRTTKAHEYLFVFSKRGKYFYNWLATREFNDDGESRNRRSVWPIPTEAFSEAHFATFPQKLVEPCVLAGTSEQGCCPKCFAPLNPIIEKVGQSFHGNERKRANAPGAEVSQSSVFRTGVINHYEITGWKPSCRHKFDAPVPCVVLDPFSGSGTTGVVADKLKRNYLGIELNEESLEISRKRLYENCSEPLWVDIEVG